MTTDRFGNANSAFQFDGASSRIELNDTIGNFDTADFSISAWGYNYDSLSGGGGYCIFGKRQTISYGSFFEIQKINDGTHWGFNFEIDQSGPSDYLSPFIINPLDSFWFHVVFVRNGFHNKTYINNVLQLDTVSTIKQNINNTAASVIGARYGGGLLWWFFKGKIDDIGIWNRALTPCEIAQLYNASPTAGAITGFNSVCIGSTITLTDTTTGGSWSSASTHVTVGSTGIVTGVSVGIDTVKYTVTNACGTVAATKIVSVNPTPLAGTIIGSDTVCIGNSITLADTTVGGTWSSALGLTTVTGGVVTGVTAGLDSVYYSVSNSCGTARAYKLVYVQSCVTGLNNINNKHSFTIQPNPTNKTITITSS